MTETRSAEKKTRPGRNGLKALGIICAAAGLFTLGKMLNFPERLEAALAWIEGLGPVAPLVFIVVYILACLFFVSGAVLTLGAGGVFGLGMGCVYVSIGSTLGAAAAFLAGRYLARDRVARKIAGNDTFTAMDQAVAVEGWKIVGLTRLSPVFPFVLLNYAFGLTKVPFGQYVAASWIGMMPGTVMYVYIGYLAAEAATGSTSSGAVAWLLKTVGFVATIIVTVMVTRIARRALNKRIPAPQ